MGNTDLIYATERKVSSAFIDSSVKLGIAQAVLLIQDNLTECFAAMDCDGVVYREKFNVFWVFTKTKVHFEKRPDWRDIISVKTFPIDNAGMRTHINTAVYDKDGQLIIKANQEACVLDMERHRPVKLQTLPYPSEGFPEAVFTEPFERFPSDFTEDDFVFEQVVRSQHIDMSHHMNNIEYIKLAFSSFDDEFLLNNEISDLEVHYLGETKEGQTLKVYKKIVADSVTGAERCFIRLMEKERCVFELECRWK